MALSQVADWLVLSPGHRSGPHLLHISPWTGGYHKHFLLMTTHESTACLTSAHIPLVETHHMFTTNSVGQSGVIHQNRKEEGSE